MADENLDMESVRISELDQTTEVDRANDYLVVSRHSDAYIDDEKSFKITPDDLLDGVGVNYNAGAHIAIDNTTHTISATYTNATTSADGLMSKEDKSTVDSLQPVATSGDYNDLTNKPTIPAAQVNSDWNSNSGVSEILNKPTLAAVATTGDYSDLSNTPTIPAAQVNSDWNSNSGLSQILNKPQLSAVATSGNYADLSNTPTIPEDLADLGDVNIALPEDNQVLKYDANSGKWINSTGGGGGGASDLNDLDDVTITTPSENQVLKYNGTQWVNATSPAGATNLDGLTDVTIATPTAGQALVYDDTSGEWENKAVDYANIANKPSLATVATSGSYTDLSNTPTIPAAQVNSDWNSTSGVSEILNKPTIPTVNDATITVVQGSTTKGTFTLNQGTDATITLDAGGSGGASALDDLTDVDITNPSANQVLKYDGTSWVNGTGGGSGAEYVELTQSEYDALTPAEKKNGTMYFITDTDGDGQEFQPIIYSTEEREIGVWLDGKPLYEKTVEVASLPNNTYAYITTPPDLDFLVDASGVAYQTTDSSYARTMPFVGGGANDIRLDLNDGTIRVVTFADWSGYSAYITVRYTKSTDTAGSGTWTPQGVPAIHYSTDEQIVGTWIDGSTIYEMTFDIRANAETISDTLFADLQISKIIDLYLMLYAGYVFQKSLNISYNTSTNKLTVNEGTKYVQFITVRYIKSDIQ